MDHSPEEKNWGDEGRVNKCSAHRRKMKTTHFLSERVLLRADDGVVVVESLLQLRRRETHLLCESLTAVELLHQTTADVVFAVPLDLLRRLSVENESNRVLDET